MKLVRPSYEIWNQQSGLLGVHRQIERAGRICYKSETNTTDDSARSFVDRLIGNGHLAMLEHGTVYLKAPLGYTGSRYTHNPYSKYACDADCEYVTTNYRVLVENNWLDDLKCLCEPTSLHEMRYTVRFVCDRGVSHEFVRQRKFSFAQESTRFCNYSKDRFNNELTFIQPCWLANDLCGDYKGHLDIIAKTPMSGYDRGGESFLHHMVDTEILYLDLLVLGWKPQEARAILPNALKTELVMTGFISDWRHFFDLRAVGTTGAPHPQAKELAEPLMNEFKDRGYL